MRKSLSLAFSLACWFGFALACIVVGFAGSARAQQIDLAAGGSTLFSSSPTVSSQAFLPPAMKGGVYTGVSAGIVMENHFGFNAEASFRYKQGLYNGYQRYRPVFYDFNGLYARRLSPKIGADFMAGIGGETLIFYNQFGSCASGSCAGNINSTHFLLHAGASVPYYFFRHYFVRPEANYYRVINNSQFHSGNIIRLGASIGYTFTAE